MTSAEFIAKARSAVNHGTIYTLGQGGTSLDDWRTKIARVPLDDPRTAPNPVETYIGISDKLKQIGECDCSGFVAWALGVKRHLTGVPWYDVAHNGEWLNTDAIVRDANSMYGFFDRVPSPIPGCLIVFPKQPGATAGHVGIVAEVGGGVATKVVHCSHGNYRASLDAVRETPPTVFPKAISIYARCAMVSY